MSQILENLKYSKEHEWLNVENGIGIVGITDFAQEALGDIVFVELPEIGSILKKDKTFGVIESIKSVSDLFAPVSGEVIEVNNNLIDTPELLNSSPYGSWMIKLKISNEDEINHLLDHHQYEEYCSKK